MEVEFLGILSGGNVVEYWMSSPCQAIYLYIQVFHLGISDTVTLRAGGGWIGWEKAEGRKGGEGELSPSFCCLSGWGQQ